ncbi:hypothetical protein HK100_010294, partial [Physocladia obscura]
MANSENQIDATVDLRLLLGVFKRATSVGSDDWVHDFKRTAQLGVALFSGQSAAELESKRAAALSKRISDAYGKFIVKANNKSSFRIGSVIDHCAAKMSDLSPLELIPSDLTMVLIGTAGAGKSTIAECLGADTRGGVSLGSGLTIECKKYEVPASGKKFEVLDTPGIPRGSAAKQVDVMNIILESISALKGPRAYIIVWPGGDGGRIPFELGYLIKTIIAICGEIPTSMALLVNKASHHEVDAWDVSNRMLAVASMGMDTFAVARMGFCLNHSPINNEYLKRIAIAAVAMLEPSSMRLTQTTVRKQHLVDEVEIVDARWGVSEVAVDLFCWFLAKAELSLISTNSDGRVELLDKKLFELKVEAYFKLGEAEFIKGVHGVLADGAQKIIVGVGAAFRKFGIVISGCVGNAFSTAFKLVLWAPAM